MANWNKMSFSNLNNYIPSGHKLLFVIKKKFSQLSNIMKLGSYSALYVFLKHPEICSCSKYNTQFVQLLVYFRINKWLCLSLSSSISHFLMLGRERVRGLLDYLITFIDVFRE